jgi:hypothetical protein
LFLVLWVAARPLWRQLRLLWLASRLGGRVGFGTVTGVTDGARWTLRFWRQSPKFNVWSSHRRPTPMLRVVVDADLDWTATDLEAAGLNSEGLGPGGARLGDALFDDAVALHGDPRLLAAIFTTEVEGQVLGWVTQGREIGVNGLSMETRDRGNAAAEAALAETVALAVAFRSPSDPRAALMERALSAEVGPSLRAAALLGADLPPGAAETLRRRARAQLLKGHLEVPSLETLMVLEPRSDDVTAAILPLLRAPRGEVRLAAVRALARLGTSAAVPALRAMPAGGPTHELHQAVDEAVAAIGQSSDAGRTRAAR